MKPRAFMLMGTGSDVGKSLVAAGLCRAFARRGLKVMPFKPQNMSLNSAVASDGDDVFERDDALRRPVLVHDDGHVLLDPPEIVEQRRQVFRLRDDVRRSQ